MRKIIYYVATSIDGFISGPDEDISGFVQVGKGVDKYLSDLKKFDTVIMGRKTYEFGYKFGLQPGQPAYAHMEHFIFSSSLTLDNPSEQVHICPLDIQKIQELKKDEGSDIYLCGGGEFAGWLLENQMIEILKIKLNPLILGAGVKLFGSSKKQYRLILTDQENFDEGPQILTYDIVYQ
ncbi:dihydrofolate reductase family protein [Fulvivirgaceae bacterium BMA10]|uniref:Dihydrofolate reductase family protein n=1 Tax=Splendidivirga corallicola TaxID=3051826 RepID=A0ABT8KV62_9BACT|nr:dihydrofolate reductase family protein [Fulvivirgaceae bacterium BMA10]